MKSPTFKIHKSIRSPSRFFYTLEEMTAIRESARNPEDELRIRLQAQAGLSAGEAATFSLEMVDLELGRIVLRTASRCPLRSIPIQPGIGRHIEKIMAGGPSSRDLTLDGYRWSKRLYQIVRMAGIEVILHGLRHGYAVHRRAQGVSPWQLRMELGVPLAWLDLLDLAPSPPASAENTTSWFSA
jgi:integrase